MADITATEPSAPTFYSTFAKVTMNMKRKAIEAEIVLEECLAELERKRDLSVRIERWDRYQMMTPAQRERFADDLKDTARPEGEIMTQDRIDLTGDGMRQIVSLLGNPVYCEKDVVGALSGWVGGEILRLSVDKKDEADLLAFVRHINTIARRAEISNGSPFQHGFRAGQIASEFMSHTCTPARGNWDRDDVKQETWKCDYFTCCMSRQCARRWQDPFDGAIPKKLFENIPSDESFKPLHTRTDDDGVEWVVVSGPWYAYEGRWL